MLIMLTFIQLLQLEAETKGGKGMWYIVVGGMASAIVALSVYIRQVHKESFIRQDAARQEHLKNVQEIMNRQAEVYQQLTEKNTKAINDNTTETRLLNKTVEDLSRLIREKLS